MLREVEGGQGEKALHAVGSAGDLVEARIVCRAGCTLRQGAGLVKPTSVSHYLLAAHQGGPRVSPSVCTPRSGGWGTGQAGGVWAGHQQRPRQAPGASRLQYVGL